MNKPKKKAIRVSEKIGMSPGAQPGAKKFVGSSPLKENIKNMKPVRNAYYTLEDSSM